MNTRPTLRQIQTWFKWRVSEQHEGFSPPLPSPLPEISDQAVALRPKAHPEFDSNARLEIYSYAYLARMKEALAEDYWVTQKIADDKKSGTWDRISAYYFSQYPSRSFTLTDVGRFFPAFLAEDSVLQELPYLADLARFEWALIESFYATELPPFDPRSLLILDHIPASQVRIGLDTSVRLLQSNYPIDLIYESQLPPPSQPLRSSDTFLMTYKREDQPRYTSLLAYQFRLLRHFENGKSLEDAIQQCSVQEPSVAAIEKDFQNWTQQGIIREVRALS